MRGRPPERPGGYGAYIRLRAPAELLTRLLRVTAEGQRSRFIREAVEAELDRIEREQVPAGGAP
jgi:hypothetical protein